MHLSYDKHEFKLVNVHAIHKYIMKFYKIVIIKYEQNTTFISTKQNTALFSVFRLTRKLLFSVFRLTRKLI